jgi:FkbM family methyltransferase
MKVSWRKRLTRTIRRYLRTRVLSKHGIAVLTQSRNGLLAVDPGEFSVSRSLLERGEYGWSDITALSSLLTHCERPYLVFAGAHIGSLLVPIVHATRPQQVLAFEPSPANCRLLELNLRLNGIESVEVQRMAVGDVPGKVLFTQNRTNSGNSRVEREHGEIEVSVVPLDKSPLAEWERIDLLVMDTEGFEAHAMRGGQQTLSRTRYFCVEYAPEQLREQGSSVEEFIALAAAQFPSMYILGPPARFFGANSYVDYLKQLPAQRGLLMNLLFCRDQQPDPRLA